jgi:hypothetical protein
VTADRTKLIRVAVANCCSRTPSAVEIKTRKAPIPFPDRIVEGRWETERSEVHSVLAFRCICTANKAIESVTDIQDGVGVEGMNLVNHPLFGDELKAVANVNRSGVVIVSALTVVPTVAAKYLVVVTSALVQPQRVIPVRWIQQLGQRRIANVVIDTKTGWGRLLWRTEGAVTLPSLPGLFVQQVGSKNHQRE